ncbi:male sterility protein [Glomus cerebriforme]|uniref:Male sterility protein n=1 Tax=Glomus cerebriforme TaxID=658196 RepID=A0A397TVK3_9GLOM|nr:male sterility protein [Glomus cerebriforme]
MTDIITTSDSQVNQDDNLTEIQLTQPSSSSSISDNRKGKQKETSTEDTQLTSTKEVQINSIEEKLSSSEINLSSNKVSDTREVLLEAQVDDDIAQSSSSSSSSNNNMTNPSITITTTTSLPSSNINMILESITTLPQSTSIIPKKSSKEINNNRNKNAGLNDIDIRNYLQFTAAMIMGVPLKELDDHSTSLMKLGMDSNTSIIFLKKIADILPSFIELPSTFIEDNSSIDLITQFILDIMSGGGENFYNKQKRKLPNELEEEQERLQRSVEDLVDKYTLYIRDNYIQQSSDVETHEQKVFLLTGATGFLGAHILDTLLRHSGSTIYCLVKRKKAQSPKASLKRAFLRNGFDGSLIDSKQLVALSSNLSEPYLGLTIQQYEEISQKVTSVIHGAFTISMSSKFSCNVNNSLIHYENNFILGTANLLLFSAQKEFHFISSLDCCLNGPWEKVPEGIIPLKASITTGDGCGLTRLVLETILINTFDYLQLERVSIIRTSQLTSNSKSGVWNPNDMIPLLLRNAGITGKIPVFEEKLDWIPVDIAAKSIVDLIITENRFSKVEVFHVSNPNSIIMWKDYLGILEGSAGMKFQRIELEQWLEKLEESITDGIYDEGMFMILNEYFKRFLNRMMMEKIDDSKSTGRAMLDITNTKSRTYILSKCPSLNEKLVSLNIDWLRNTGNLSELASPPTSITRNNSSKVTISDSSNSTNANEKQLQRRSKSNKLKINGEGSVWNLLYVTIPLMIFFFVIDILWSIVSKSFFEVSIIAGWIATVVFVDDNQQQQNVVDASEELLNDIDRIEREFRHHKKNSASGRRIVFRKKAVRNIKQA